MDNNQQTKRFSTFFIILVWGAMWGIFEATFGYLLHLLPFNISWLIWYPVACFFMANVYRKTQKTSAVVIVGVLCASIKMLNLLLPGRIDRVINPAVSIVFEALTIAAVIFISSRYLGEKRKAPFAKALAVLGMNTGWRLLFSLYLLFLVPDWIREVSVISSAEKFIPFFVTQNLVTSAVLFIGYQYMHFIFKPIIAIEQKISFVGIAISTRAMRGLKTGTAVLMVCIYAVLEVVL